MASEDQPKNPKLRHQIINTGQQLGLFFDDGELFPQKQAPEEDDKPTLTKPVQFTLRPVGEYLQNYRPSWTRMTIDPAADEEGADGLGAALVFEVSFRLAYADGFSSDAPSQVLDDILARLEDFARSHPDAAAALFENQLLWEMSIQGDIVYEDEEYGSPILDLGIYPELGLSVPVYVAGNEADFENDLSTLDDDTPMAQAIREMMQYLALLMRWLDTESPSQPPLLDTLLD